MTRRSDKASYPDAIPQGSTEKRQAALARRLGGNPSPVQKLGKKQVVLPSITRWGDCEGQLDILAEIEADEGGPV